LGARTDAADAYWLLGVHLCISSLQEEAVSVVRFR
jgi:hypothetical protein